MVFFIYLKDVILKGVVLAEIPEFWNILSVQAQRSMDFLDKLMGSIDTTPAKSEARIRAEKGYCRQ